MRRVALAIARVPSARSALELCDNATELTEFYSSCDIVRQPLGRQKRMTIFAICLQNDCKREENGDACVASLAEKIITISIYKSLRVKTGQYPAFRRDPSVREDWTNQGRALRRLGEPNAGRAYGSHRPAAVPQSALRGGSSQSHDLLRAFRVVYRSGIPVRPATFGTLHFPSILSGLRPNDATKIAQIQKGPLMLEGVERGQYPARVVP